MESRFDVINALIKRYGYTRYLEIGYQYGVNFDAIECDYKVSVDIEGDPDYKMTSDEFFEFNDETFDLIFIDGCHQYEVVTRDVANALTRLNENGCLVIHDTNPALFEHTGEAPTPGVAAWCGNVWRAIIDLRRRSDLMIYTVDTDWGVTIVAPSEDESIIKPRVTEDGGWWAYFDANREKVLNLESVENFIDWLN